MDDTQLTLLTQREHTQTRLCTQAALLSTSYSARSILEEGINIKARTRRTVAALMAAVSDGD